MAALATSHSMSLALDSPVLASIPTGVSLRRLSMLVSASANDLVFLASPKPSSIGISTAGDTPKRAPPPSPAAGTIDASDGPGRLSTALSLAQVSLFFAATTPPPSTPQARQFSTHGKTEHIVSSLSASITFGSLPSELAFAVSSSQSLSASVTSSRSIDDPTSQLEAKGRQSRRQSIVYSLDGPILIPALTQKVEVQVAGSPDINTLDQSTSTTTAPLLDKEPSVTISKITNRQSAQPSLARLVHTTSTSLSFISTVPTYKDPFEIDSITSAIAYLSSSLNNIDAYETALSESVASATIRRNVLKAELAQAKRDEARDRQMARWARTLTLRGPSADTAFLPRPEDSTGSLASGPRPRIASTIAISHSRRRRAVCFSEELCYEGSPSAPASTTPLTPLTPSTAEEYTSIHAPRVFSREALEPLENGAVERGTGLWRIPSLSGPARVTHGIKEGIKRRLAGTLGRRSKSRTQVEREAGPLFDIVRLGGGTAQGTH